MEGECCQIPFIPNFDRLSLKTAKIGKKSQSRYPFTYIDAFCEKKVYAFLKKMKIFCIFILA